VIRAISGTLNRALFSIGLYFLSYCLLRVVSCDLSSPIGPSLQSTDLHQFSLAYNYRRFIELHRLKHCLRQQTINVVIHCDGQMIITYIELQIRLSARIMYLCTHVSIFIVVYTCRPISVKYSVDKNENSNSTEFDNSAYIIIFYFAIESTIKINVKNNCVLTAQ